MKQNIIIVIVMVIIVTIVIVITTVMIVILVIAMIVIKARWTGEFGGSYLNCQTCRFVIGSGLKWHWRFTQVEA